MPELPEVETVARTLRSSVEGRRIEAVDVRRADVVRPKGFDLASAMAGHAVLAVTRRAKRIVFDLEGGRRFYIHLGMSGRLTIEQADAPLLAHTHLIVRLAKCELRFRDPRRFGGVFWMCPNGVCPGGEHAGLGPEPLDISAAELHERLRRTRRSIKAALLDQSLIAGLGNIYVDESLHAAKLHPHRLANWLSRKDVERLTGAIKSVLRRAVRHRGSTLRDYVDADGSGGQFQLRHAVYGRDGQSCRSCMSTIRRIIVAGRSTHFCPRCQRPPRRRLQGQHGAVQ